MILCRYSVVCGACQKRASKSQTNKQTNNASEKQCTPLSTDVKSCNFILNDAYKVLRELVSLLVHIHEVVLWFRERDATVHAPALTSLIPYYFFIIGGVGLSPWYCKPK
jgi:hypothetical protein